MADTKKSGTTFIAVDTILNLAKEMDLKTKEKSGCYRIEGESKHRRLLVHKAKKGTNCIELVGFESKGAIKHPCPPTKTMTQMVDFNEDEKTILGNLNLVIGTMQDLMDDPVIVEPKVAPKPAPKVEPKPEPKPEPKKAPAPAKKTSKKK